MSESTKKDNATFHAIDLPIQEPKKVSCFRCRNFQIGSSIFVILAITTIILVFYPITIVFDIEWKLVTYAVGYGALLFMSGLLLFAGIKFLIEYCKEEDQSKRYVDNLIVGFACLFFSLVFLIVVIYFLPATIEEYPIEFLDDSQEMNAIFQLSCRTFEMGYNKDLKEYIMIKDGEWVSIENIGIIGKHESCMEKKN